MGALAVCRFGLAAIRGQRLMAEAFQEALRCALEAVSWSLRDTTACSGATCLVWTGMGDCCWITFTITLPKGPK